MITYFKDWKRITKKDELAETQRHLIQHCLPCLDNPDQQGRVAHILQTYIDKNQYLNELKISNVPENSTQVAEDNLLMIHGYGAGVGIFCRNYNEISNVSNKTVLISSIDLLGHSLSSASKIESNHRKNFTSPKIKITYTEPVGKSSAAAKENNNENLTGEDTDVRQDETKVFQEKSKIPINKEKDISSFDYQDSPTKLLEIANNTELTIKEYEDFYVESIEKWRKLNNLDKFDLLGHSFGAYLSFSYICKYPEHVRNLILVSPVGVERSLFAIGALRYHANNNQTKNIKPSEDRASYDHTGWFVRMPTFVIKFWDSAMLPFPLMRGLGPVGVWLASRYTNFRYNEGSTDPEELRLLQRYSLASFWKQSSTEKSISTILSPIVSARDPILDKLERFLKDAKLNGKFPETLWIYGEKDWMDLEAGKLASNFINEKKLGKFSSLQINSKSGHNLFLDNPSEFNSIVKKFLKWE